MQFDSEGVTFNASRDIMFRWKIFALFIVERTLLVAFIIFCRKMVENYESKASLSSVMPLALDVLMC